MLLGHGANEGHVADLQQRCRVPTLVHEGRVGLVHHHQPLVPHRPGAGLHLARFQIRSGRVVGVADEDQRGLQLCEQTRGFGHLPAELPFTVGRDEKRFDLLEAAGRLVLAEGRGEDGCGVTPAEPGARDQVNQLRRSVSNQDAVRSNPEIRAQSATELGAFGIRVGGQVHPPDGLSHPRGGAEGVDAGAEVHYAVGTQAESFQLGRVQTAMDRAGVRHLSPDPSADGEHPDHHRQRRHRHRVPEPHGGADVGVAGIPQPLPDPVVTDLLEHYSQ